MPSNSTNPMPTNKSLKDRIAALEAELAGLRGELDQPPSLRGSTAAAVGRQPPCSQQRSYAPPQRSSTRAEPGPGDRCLTPGRLQPRCWPPVRAQTPSVHATVLQQRAQTPVHSWVPPACSDVPHVAAPPLRAHSFVPAPVSRPPHASGSASGGGGEHPRGSRTPGLPAWPPSRPTTPAANRDLTAASSVARPSPVASPERRCGVADDDSLSENGEIYDGGSSSSLSPPRVARHRPPPSGTPPDEERRIRRQSSGLVFNPGSATVECLKGSKGGCRFSFSKGEQGEQMLLPLDELRPLTEIQAADAAARSSATSGPARKGGGSPGVARTMEVAAAGLNPAVAAASAGAAVPASSVQASSAAALEPAGALFSRFLTADSLVLTQSIFEQLLARCDCDGAHGASEAPYRRLQRLCGGDLPWRARSVWKGLDARAQRSEYAVGSLARTRAVVCGAGPVGLRAALELALLHANVTVVEKRPDSEAFCRINRVHLWEWCKQDLLGWGAKVFDPPGGTFGGDNDFCHIGINELQLLLFKNALLLGVNFRFGAEAQKTEKPTTLLCKDGTKLPCDVLLLADGANSPLSRTLGLRSIALGLRGKGSAIGVVANFVNDRCAEQMALRQFSWARQFNLPLFSQLADRTSINLENVVYYKGPTHHYMVMTPTRRSLLDAGVLRDGNVSSRLLHGSNVDISRLSAMVKQVASFFHLPTELCESQGCMIFDFSGIKRLENPATFVDGIFVCAVGDALLEPFWPEGLGIMRGFMSALDAAAAVVKAASGRPKEALAQVVETYNILKSVAAQTASQCLQKDQRNYGLQPRSRYIFSHGHC